MRQVRSCLGFALLVMPAACSTAGTTDGETASGGSVSNGGSSPSSGGTSAGGTSEATGGLTSSGGSFAMGGSTGLGGSTNMGGVSGGVIGTGGSVSTGGATAPGGTTGGGGVRATGGSAGGGGVPATGGSASGGAATGGSSGGEKACTGPVGSISGALATGIAFMDTDGQRVNAHGGGIIREGDTYYMHGEFFSSTTTDNNFNGFSMYSSKDLATWKNEGLILPQQASGELGPSRKGERPHIIKCPSTGEFVLYAHAASTDYQTDKEIVYATSATVNGKYSYKGPLKNASGALVVHSDMSAYADSTGAYVLTESGHVYTLATDCHSWVSDKTYSAVNGDSGGIEAPTVFKAGSTYYWLGSYKTGWRANNNFYSTAPAMTGPWTYQGYLAPVTDPSNNISDQRTWLSQVTWVQPVVGCTGTVYVFWGDHWDGTQDTSAPGKHNNLATYVFQPLVFTGTKISLPTYHANWKLDVGAGTWTE